MSYDNINIGSAANDGTGDPARTAFGKVNANTQEALHGFSGAAAVALAAVPVNDANFDAGPAIRAAIAASPLVILDPTKTYYLNSADPLDGAAASCVFIQNRALRLDCRGAKIITRSNRTSIQITQTPTHDVSVTGVTVVNRILETDGLVTPVARLDVSSTAGFAVGDVVKIAATDVIPGMAGNGYQVGEFATVGEVDAGNNHIYLTATLHDAYTTGVRLARLRPNRIEIVNARFNHDDAGSAGGWNATHINMKGCIEPVLSGIYIERSFGHGIVNNSCFGARGDITAWNCNPESGAQRGTGYCWFEQSIASTRLIINGGRARHLFTTNPRNPAADDFFFRR